jgi:hypothetical protein
VTYTLEWIDSAWRVTRAVYAGEPPGW